nr:zinc finger BED domain-containing protein RICESLEEPER 2 [Tanacetum cinerariifolium]
MYSLLVFLFERFNSTLKNHISHPHCEALKRAAEQGQSSMSRDRSIFVHNPDVLREQFAGLAKEITFPVLSRMAMDILSVQATSVASESAFSTSGRVLSIRRTRLTPASLKMHFEEEIMDAEVQANETIPFFDEEISLDAASSECSMSGPDSRGEEAEAEKMTSICGLRILKGKHGKMIQVERQDEKTLEFKAPILVEELLPRYPGAEAVVALSNHHYHLPLRYKLKSGNMYYLVPNEPNRISQN